MVSLVSTTIRKKTGDIDLDAALQKDVRMTTLLLILNQIAVYKDNNEI